ncbi:MAG TPA: DapH/DapD/GlmU-related protein [Bryobacteraceae bacterium]|nr:DapH/DapD/GlmU-related protein [Bryobacteraceae bacterium]
MGKRLIQGIAFVLVLPSVLLSGFGRARMIFCTFAQFYALVPGVAGDYLRIAFYKGTLEQCSLNSRVSFGTFFAHPEARVSEGVYIGAYCVLGRVHVGARTQIASGVQVLSGKSQHTRDAEGRISGSEHGAFSTVSIGADCWIGAAAIVMADVGDHATVGAGAVVTKPVPANSTAAGNPARLLA